MSIAVKGSQAWMQRAIASNCGYVGRASAGALGTPQSTVSWKSPKSPDFEEARDGAALRLLGIEAKSRALSEFWPNRGPVWDGLAVVDGRPVLIEAKAHIPELLSQGSKATGASLEKITASLARTRKSLAPRSKVDWATSPFFQYANRLSFLQFLRQDNGIDAHLVFLYLTNDAVMSGPDSDDEWRGALRLMDASLGLGKHALQPFVHKVFLDCRKIGAPKS